MAAPNQPEDTASDTGSGPVTKAASALDGSHTQPPRVLRLRLVPWDVVFTLVVLAVLAFFVTMTSWPTRLFAYTDNLCVTEDCPPVPFGLNYYIYPLTWGGIGAAITAAVIGPFVSMLRGWYMSFWPFVSIAVVTVTSVGGYALVGFSERYWH
ncbi:MAG: hypothetical protein ACLPXZ_23850 [Mycobacterium sp.]